MTADPHDPTPDSRSANNLDIVEDKLPPELAELCLSKIEPVLFRYFSGKLRSSMRYTDDDRANQDALELASEAKIRILRKLHNSGSGIGTQVDEIEAYTRAVARNVFHQYLRSKYPRRLSIKNQCRYLLTHHRELELWKNENDLFLCGLNSFDRQGSRATSIGLSPEVCEELKSKIGGGRAATTSGLIDAVFLILRHIGRPISLDDLVSAVMETLQITEPVEAPQTTDLSNMPAPSGSSQNIVETEEFVSRLWREILLLPLRHRAALLLNFRDESGEDLVSSIIANRAASVRDIAAALEIDPERFAQIWKDLPWDDRCIAEHLGLERQQVINLRQSAKQKLRRKLAQ